MPKYGLIMPHTFLLLWLTCFALAVPRLDHRIAGDRQQQHNTLPLRKRQSNSNSFPIVGIQNAGVQPRLEIRDLQKIPDAWNIFILGLAKFQAMPQDHFLSYYGVATIHGLPYEPWDNVQPAPGITSPGYCQHGTNIFLPWHRPENVLFEQIWFEHVTDAVNEFPEGPVRQRYAQAAMQCRFPFWDFAKPEPDGSGAFPTAITSPTVQVTLPNGTATIKNPLFSYDFHPVSASDFANRSPFSAWTETKRYPTTQNEDAVSQNAAVAQVLNSLRVNFMNRIYNLLVFYDDFADFSNQQSNNAQNADSLESVHDAIHALTGSGGHMQLLEYAAYDPLFWLLHGFIDFIFDLFQVLHPDTYVVGIPASSQSFTNYQGDYIDADSPLQPFSRDTSHTKWTSNTVRTTTQFGYTYPDTASRNQTEAREAVNRLYGANAANGGPLRKRSPLDVAGLSEVLNAPGELNDGRVHEYTVNVASDRHALGQSYIIYIFVGDFDDSDPSSWATSPNLAGIHGQFAGPSTANLPPRKTTGNVPLTDSLLSKFEAGVLKSMEEVDVVAFLAVNLHWRVATFDFKAVPLDKVSDLSIVVNSAMVTPRPRDDAFPTRSDFKELGNVTQGKVGGFRI